MAAVLRDLTMRKRTEPVNADEHKQMKRHYMALIQKTASESALKHFHRKAYAPIDDKGGENERKDEKTSL